MDSEIDAKESGTISPDAPIRFGECVIDPSTHRLWRGGELVHLPRLPFDVLVHLVKERPRLVSREALLERFWPNMPGGDQALTRCLSTVRKALGDVGEPARFIETRHGVGYRFIAAVSPPAARSAPTTLRSAHPDAASVRAAGVDVRAGLDRRRWVNYAVGVSAVFLLLVIGVMAWARFEIERAVRAGAEAILARERSRADAATLRSQFVSMRRAKLLWVDDHPEGNRAEIEAFTHAGVVVDVARSNAEAAEYMRGREYNLIISDIGRDAPQPQRAGLDLPRELLPDRNRVPPIVYYVVHREDEHTRDGYPVTQRPSELFRMASELLGAAVAPQTAPLQREARR
jgi:DNA-binding response OmpR family regulator